MTATEPVADWATDYDIFDSGYVVHPYPIWDELRERCPIAHTERWGSSWMPTRYEDIRDIAADVETFSSTEILVVPPPAAQPEDGIAAPPITSDPPEHHWSRRLILPAFSPKKVKANHEPFTRALCRRLLDGFDGRDRVDAAGEYAQQIPPAVIAHLVGIPEEMSDEFVEWVRGVLELGLTDDELRMKYRAKILDYFWRCVEDRKENPRDDLVTELLNAEVDGEPVPDTHIIGTLNLLLVAGIDTTWSSIGSALWHLASHPEDRRRLVAEPELIPTAVEEFLRAYAPVTMARKVMRDVEVAGCPMRQGDKVLMSFPAANRDPEAFADADQVIIDRAENRHIAFGVGIHRCAGSNLARMEMNVAIEEWLARCPEFGLVDPAAVTWAGGQVRGPRELLVELG